MGNINFVVTATGDISTDVEGDSLGIDEQSARDAIDAGSSVTLDDVQVTGTVTISARATVEDIDVEASDLENFDAETTISDAVNPYGCVDVSDASYEVTRGPAGWDDMVALLGYDSEQAVSVFALLDRTGYSY